MSAPITVKICRYINENFRKQHHSNRDFCLTCGIDEKTGRLILQEDYNLSLKLLKQICEAHYTKLSTVFIAIDE